MSKFDAISALERVTRIRGNRVHGAIETIGRLVIIYELVKRI
jgi:hypothetical protein